MSKKTMLICVSGGTGSGKTTIANEIISNLPKNYRTTIIFQDSYYNDNTHLTMEQRKLLNYDHPNAFDWKLLKKHINELLEGKLVQVPIYDFKEHNRSSQVVNVGPVDVIIVEGLFSYYDKEIDSIADLKVYVDTPDDERLLRRMIRDIKERGRDLDGVAKQWRESVNPMYKTFIEPQKRDADLVIPWSKMNYIAIDVVKALLSKFVEGLDESKKVNH